MDSVKFKAGNLTLKLKIKQRTAGVKPNIIK